MPGSMVHLMVARLMPEGNQPLFLLGSIAPDAIDQHPGATRADKDKMHYRNENRWQLLKALAESIHPDDHFAKGYLLHLYTDALWDAGPQADYKIKYPSDNWIVPYRKELALCGSWLYWHEDWSKKVWEAMRSVSQLCCKIEGCPNCEEILMFRETVFGRNQERQIGPSEIFTPELVDLFSQKTADAYRQWVDSLRIWRTV